MYVRYYQMLLEGMGVREDTLARAEALNARFRIDQCWLVPVGQWVQVGVGKCSAVGAGCQYLLHAVHGCFPFGGAGACSLQLQFCLKQLGAQLAEILL